MSPITSQIHPGGVDLVFGAGRSGLAAARLLREQNESVLLVDESAPEGMDERLGWLGRQGIKYCSDFQRGRRGEPQ